MPKLLANRLRLDSIRGFLTAAALRYDEGWGLAEKGHRTAAVNLWGSAAESVLKAAWFRLKRFNHAQTIGLTDLRNAKNEATDLLGIAWPSGGLHNIDSWARSIAAFRGAYGPAYATPYFAPLLLYQATTVYSRWNESLQYKSNVAFDHEVRSVAKSVSWFLSNASKI